MLILISERDHQINELDKEIERLKYEQLRYDGEE